MKVRRLGALLLILLLFLVCFPDWSASAQDPEVSNSIYDLELVINHQFRSPVYFTEINDGSGRYVVVEERGVVYIIQNGQVYARPFLDLEMVINSDEIGQGLLGLAFHPNYAENGLFFIYFTRAEDGDTIVARLKVSSKDPNRAAPTSFTPLLHIDQPAAAHNGGMLAFGPDGDLYIGVGDGGGTNDELNNAQNTFTLLGSILRIDVDHRSADFGEYAIPSDNPFADGQLGLPEVFVYGLSNPWRFSFDRQTGDMWIADAGQADYEEVNIHPADLGGGINYGWPAYEGSSQFRFDDFPLPSDEVRAPISEYDHTNGCAVTGGYVYRGSEMPELTGKYIFGDFCRGVFWTISRDVFGAWETRPFMESAIEIRSFGQNTAGELFIVDRQGWIYKLIPAPDRQ